MVCWQTTRGAERGAHDVIPPRKNAKPWKTETAGAVARNEALRASKHLGRALCRRWSGYHRRSRAETKMHCVKLLGQRLMARDFDRLVAEFQIGVAVLNGYTALRIPVTKVAGWLSGDRGSPAVSRFVQQSHDLARTLTQGLSRNQAMKDQNGAALLFAS